MFSWGADWGMGGFMTLVRNASNTCLIARDAYFPVLQLAPSSTLAAPLMLRTLLGAYLVRMMVGLHAG